MVDILLRGIHRTLVCV